MVARAQAGPEVLFQRRPPTLNLFGREVLPWVALPYDPPFPGGSCGNRAAWARSVLLDAARKLVAKAKKVGGGRPSEV